MRYLITAVLVLMAGLLLNAIKPIWLAPPLFAYTRLLYIILMYGWLLLLYPVLRHLGRRRSTVLLALLLLAFGQWFCWASIAPRKQIIELVGDASGIAHRQCEYRPSDAERTYYECELRVGSSDSAREWVLRQKFMLLEGLPLMWQTESDFWIE